MKIKCDRQHKVHNDCLSANTLFSVGLLKSDFKADGVSKLKLIILINKQTNREPSQHSDTSPQNKNSVIIAKCFDFLSSVDDKSKYSKQSSLKNVN